MTPGTANGCGQVFREDLPAPAVMSPGVSQDTGFTGQLQPLVEPQPSQM